MRWGEHTRYRHELWSIRDDVVDDILDGRLPADSEPVRRLLFTIHASIQEASRQTLREGILAFVILRDLVPESSIGRHIFGDVTLPEEETARLGSYVRRLEDAGVAHLKSGSPLGWIVVCVASLVHLVIKHEPYGETCESVGSRPMAQSRGTYVLKVAANAELVEPLIRVPVVAGMGSLSAAR